MKEKSYINKTYSIDAINAEALRIWAFENNEKYSQILNRLIEENCPKEIMDRAKKNSKTDSNT